MFFVTRPQLGAWISILTPIFQRPKHVSECSTAVDHQIKNQVLRAQDAPPKKWCISVAYRLSICIVYFKVSLTQYLFLSPHLQVVCLLCAAWSTQDALKVQMAYPRAEPSEKVLLLRLVCLFKHPRMLLEADTILKAFPSVAPPLFLLPCEIPP